MHITLAVAFAALFAAPLVGRWRANVWLKKHINQNDAVKAIAEIA